MTVFVTMKGLLEPIRLDTDFISVVNEVNMAGAQGKTFVIGRQHDGRPVGIHMENILTLAEVEDPDDDEVISYP